MKRILVTGATGQIGTELVPALREKYGNQNVIATGYKKIPDSKFINEGPYTILDVTDINSAETIVKENRIDTIFHLAALLSAVAEQNPQLAWQVNMGGLYNILEVCRKNDCALFFPSSIGAFGPGTPKQNTPQQTIQRPNTMYGVCKVSGELLCDYYFTHFGVDTRGVRFPGLISYKTLPGGGTTDYAVEIFYAAIQNREYECFLKKGTWLDFMYMPDAIRAAMEIMEADSNRLKYRNSYNIASMSIAPEDFVAEIQRIVPGFSIKYNVDPLRQSIADSWPHKLDDSEAHADWGWRPEYDLGKMTKDMMDHLLEKL